MRKVLIAVGLMLGIGHAAAADYPTRPIRLIVPLPAGTSTDVIARVLADTVSPKLGQQIIIDNKPGADGAIAASEVKRSAADGYVIMLASNTAMSGVPATRKAPPYDSSTDFTPITDIGRYNFFFFVNKDIPARTLAEFIAYARANPGKLAYGAGNISGRLAFASLATTSGLDLTHVPYRGEPPAMTDLITGRINAMVATSGTGMPQVKDGKIVALATILEKRSAIAPDVPTIAEAGFSDFKIEPWAGLFGPPGMPADIVAKLNKAFHEAMADPVVKQRMVEQDFALTPSTPEELAALMKRQLEVHRKIVAAAGIEMMP
ncbi:MULTISPECIES: Bug family tripartite tricarboxylate transporter substrate binding protein [unclassified Tardiphaga]|uniref:Bug family tripartite tricarboxylate transporter substrate binding protein n=1 Tax=unclassified Tardiphaga TaxID=2631404 RepID=UPI001FEFF508|nr:MULTISPECIES: tripartite tricarboxylate transporter substrate binding protein [unclassified Tardiphaga]